MADQIPAEAIEAVIEQVRQRHNNAEEALGANGLLAVVTTVLEVGALLLRDHAAADELERVAAEWETHANELDDRTDQLDPARHETRIRSQRRTASGWRYRAEELRRRVQKLRGGTGAAP